MPWSYNFLQHHACGPEEVRDPIIDAKATAGAKLGQFLMQGKVHIHTLIPLQPCRSNRVWMTSLSFEHLSATRERGAEEQTLESQICSQPFSTTLSSHSASNQIQKAQRLLWPLAQFIPPYILENRSLGSSSLASPWSRSTGLPIPWCSIYFRMWVGRWVRGRCCLWFVDLLHLMFKFCRWLETRDGIGSLLKLRQVRSIQSLLFKPFQPQHVTFWPLWLNLLQGADWL